MAKEFTSKQAIKMRACRQPKSMFETMSNCFNLGKGRQTEW